MNLPNILTVLRILLTFVFISFILRDGLNAMIIAAAIFIVASITDYFDGYFAKKYNLITNFGKLMDPIADKFLTLAAFLTFVQMQLVNVWMVALIFFREFAITSLRMLALKEKKVLAAEKSGKFKTVSQMTAIIVVLGFLIFRELSLDVEWYDMAMFKWKMLIDMLMFVTVALTLYSGSLVLYNNRDVILNKEKGDLN